MPSTEPVRVDINPDDLVVTWADDHVTRLGLVGLRRRCTCARCVDLRATDATIWPTPGAPETLRVEDAELAGAWGLNLRWNDRHETGIYRWDDLRSWCDCADCSAGR